MKGVAIRIKPQVALPLVSRIAGTIALAFILLAVSPAADAQQVGKTYRIGYLSSNPSTDSRPGWAVGAFREALRDLGYLEGQNLFIDYRDAEGGRFERLPQLAEDLVRLKPDVIVTMGSPATVAAKKVTAIVPIVFGGVADPIAAGIVRTIARPGGNATGTTTTNAELSGKRVSLLREAFPKAVRLAILTNPSFAVTPSMVAETRAASKALAFQATVFEAQDSAQLDQAFKAMRSARSEVVAVLADSWFVAQRRQIVALAAEARIPAIYHLTHFVDAGGLMSYGASYAELSRRTALFVDKILKGAKPHDLPVEQPTKFELLINLKTAKDLGITFPPALLMRADEIIQ